MASVRAVDADIEAKRRELEALDQKLAQYGVTLGRQPRRPTDDITRGRDDGPNRRGPMGERNNGPMKDRDSWQTRDRGQSSRGRGGWQGRGDREQGPMRDRDQRPPMRGRDGDRDAPWQARDRRETGPMRERSGDVTMRERSRSPLAEPRPSIRSNISRPAAKPLVEHDDMSDSASGSEDEEAPRRQSGLQSAIAQAPAAARRESAATRKTSDADAARTKRMFGVLLGTLQQFKTTTQKEKESAAMARRQSIDRKVEEKAVQERLQAREDQARLQEERRAKLQQLRELSDKRALAITRRQLRKHYVQLAHSIQLKSSPAIFFLPAKHNDKTLALLEATSKAMRDKYPAESEDEHNADEDMEDVGERDERREARERERERRRGGLDGEEEEEGEVVGSEHVVENDTKRDDAMSDGDD